ncbi:MAG: sterol desaturase family protein [Bacteroidetes bacterium]|nr:sterol desaturase family protein [Bacteroidota bacterium]
MATYESVLLIAIPFFVLLIGIEAFAAWRMGRKVNRAADVISSLSSGVTNIVKDVLGLGIVIVSYAWLVDHLAIYEIKASWLVYFIAFIVIDFAGYWMHRISHEINLFWNRHIIHHSSEEFNLSCALRQSISEVFSFIAIFMVPAALLGVPAKVITIIAPLHLFAQFWYHTRLIGKMGFLETFLVTPSHHRVHHAMNPEYLDKNYGQIFILWDKWFGTFQKELPDVAPVYGVKRPVKTWNPILINFQHFWMLLTDAFRARSFWDKLRIWFMPTGWRPKDVAEKYPVKIVEDFGHFEKFDSKPGKGILIWAWVQLLFTLGLMLYLFAQFAEIGFPGVLIYGAFLFTGVFAYTSLLDRASYAPIAELVRAAFGLGIIYSLDGSWYGIDLFIPYSTYIIAAFLILSVFAAVILPKQSARFTGSALKMNPSSKREQVK